MFIRNPIGRYLGQVLVALVIIMSLILSIVVRAPFSPYFFPNKYVKIDILEDEIWMTKSHAKKIILFRNIVNKVVKEDESILFAPFLPGLYPILGRKSPVKTTYFLFPIEDQHEMIKKLEMEKVNWIIISPSMAIVGNADSSIVNTHPILFKYIKENFIAIPNIQLPKGYYLLVRGNRLNLK